MAGNPIRATGFQEDAVLVEAGRCNITVMRYINEDSSARFCQLFDAAKAADVSVGTTTPDWIFAAGVNGVDETHNDGGILFEKGLVVAATATATGSGAVGTGTGHFFAVKE